LATLKARNKQTESTKYYQLA